MYNPLQSQSHTPCLTTVRIASRSGRACANYPYQCADSGYEHAAAGMRKMVQTSPLSCRLTSPLHMQVQRLLVRQSLYRLLLQQQRPLSALKRFRNHSSESPHPLVSDRKSPPKHALWLWIRARRIGKSATQRPLTEGQDSTAWRRKLLSPHILGPAMPQPHTAMRHLVATVTAVLHNTQAYLLRHHVTTKRWWATERGTDCRTQ